MTSTGHSGGALELYVGPIAAELAHKRAQLAVLKRRLAEREVGLVAFETELKEFEIRYRRALGQRYAILDDLAEQIEQVKLGGQGADGAGGGSAGRGGEGEHGDGPSEADGGGNDGDGQNWAWAWGEREPEPEFRRIVSAEAKRLFRSLARLIHPDLAGDPAERERRTNLMVAANHAYEQGDLETLRHLLDEWEQSPDSVVGSNPTAELERTRRQVLRVCARLEAIDRRFATLESSAMGWLRHRVEKASGEGWDLLAHMVVELDRQISEARLELERIELERGDAQRAWA
ncbi:MAG TPA: hypothetical protein VFA46_03460 [Actinomycetes bacterium]|jgi:hypothetical protein|nr:hypothetical protein [Actinomycetes bacterium]